MWRDWAVVAVRKQRIARYCDDDWSLASGRALEGTSKPWMNSVAILSLLGGAVES